MTQKIALIASVAFAFFVLGYLFAPGGSVPQEDISPADSLVVEELEEEVLPSEGEGLEPREAVAESSEVRRQVVSSSPPPVVKPAPTADRQSPTISAEPSTVDRGPSTADQPQTGDRRPSTTDQRPSTTVYDPPAEEPVVADSSSNDVVVPPAPPRRQPIDRQVSSDPAPSQPRQQAFLIPEGTVIEARLAEEISTEYSRPGDRFRAVLDRDIEAGDRVVIPSGAQLTGIILESEESGKVNGRARLVFALEAVEFAGETYELETSSIEMEAESTKKRDAAAVGGAAAVGALIGALTGGKKGAAAGAAAGAGAGTAGVLLTRGKQVEVEAERLFSFRLDRDLSIVLP